MVRCRCFTDSAALVAAGWAGTPIASPGYCRPAAPRQGRAKRVGRWLGWWRPLGNPASASKGERSPANPGRRAAGLSLKEKPRLPKGAGLEFDKGETLEVSCLTHHPNPQRRIRFRHRTWPARDRTTAITFICGAPVGNVKQFASFWLPESVISRT